MYYRSPSCLHERLDERTPLLDHRLMNQRMIIGRRGEQIAANYLQQLGYKFYAKNVRLGRDEIDIIVYDPRDRVIVFVEVKTRSFFHPDYHPNLGMTSHKKLNLKRSAGLWVAEHDFRGGYRIDLICVADGKIINHVEQVE